MPGQKAAPGRAAGRACSVQSNQAGCCQRATLVALRALSTAPQLYFLGSRRAGDRTYAGGSRDALFTAHPDQPGCRPPAALPPPISCGPTCVSLQPQLLQLPRPLPLM